MNNKVQEELFIREFKEKFYERFSYIPVVIPVKENLEPAKPIMTLEELENYFTPFLPKIMGRIQSLRSKYRYRDIVYLRFIFTHFARKMGYTTMVIGKYLNRHHTSILHYAEAFKNEIDTSEHFREKFQNVFTYIKNNYNSDDKLSAMVYFNKVWNQSKPAILS